MALTELTYPVTGIEGSYENVFPSQKPLYMDFNRTDAVITTIESGTDNNVRMTISGTFDVIEVGQWVTWQTDGYSLRSSRVVAVISTSIIEVNVTFTTTVATNGFINYYRNWFVEFRFVESDSATDDQDAIELIEDYTQTPNKKNGDVSVNISLPSDLIVPDFDIATGYASGLWVEYKLQYRQSYDANRDLAWISPTVDVPIMLVHGSLPFNESEFFDSEITKRYIRGYPLIYSIVHSDVNDNGSNSFAISIQELSISQEEIQVTEVDTVLNLNGVYVLVVDTNDLHEDTCFVVFDVVVSSSSAQYDPAQYDGSQYA